MVMEHKQKYMCHLREMNFKCDIWPLSLLLAGCGQSELKEVTGTPSGKEPGFLNHRMEQRCLKYHSQGLKLFFITTLKKTSVILVNVTF